MKSKEVREAIASLNQAKAKEMELYERALSKIDKQIRKVQAACEHQAIHHGSDAVGKPLRICANCGKDVTRC